MRLRTVVALGPAANLAFEIAFRLAEIGEASGGVVHAMQAHEVFDEGFAEAAGFFRGEIETLGELSAQDNAVDRLHQVEGRADDGIVIAVEENFGSGLVNGVKIGEDAKFAGHVVRGFHFAAEGRPAED